MLLVLAGTPDTILHLEAAKVSFRERDAKFRIGRIDDEAAYRALAEPFKRHDVDYDEDELLQVVKNAQNYPYFLQCWGAALWDAEAARQEEMPREGILAAWRLGFGRNRPQVGRETVKAAEMNANKRVHELYSERRVEFEGYGLTALAAELVLDHSAGVGLRAAADKLTSNLAKQWGESDAPPRGLPAGKGDLRRSAEQFLLHTGFVWEADPEIWEFGIPSLAPHILRTATHRIGENILIQSSLAVLERVLEFVSNSPGSRDAIVARLVETGAAANAGLAGELL